ncbi:sensor domain-containing diguanylate cyclase [Methylotenera versatilis]|jgi:diguanylate cyclase (GGDEF)-like protein/PAS domain S-box-containing protein|uniref:diguanylate cyclase n=1 Tax=Methylotenera versatilis (strain 301) TaxID=666681 RepID=D7DHJ4_METV0|nr:sensor domain-containing diguanylate cyclase [Methylotenera versatilis]ADI29529.1 diguanylate cyclase with PAS/PAC sensor [Methylotenera versatilis 301]
MTDVVDNDEQIKYKALLESTKAIPWKLDWATKQFTYIGPQIEELLGWTQSSWLHAGDWIDRIHAEDREKTANFCISQSEEGADHEADYRALKADGGYVWVRDVVHVVRKNGVTTELVGFIFDISERKIMEDKLIILNKKLEQLSFQDGLTSIANRRSFDQTLTTEWQHARRNQQPISLIIADIDCFKPYNDYYGHLQGDDCLVKVAHALSQAPMRVTDLVARYGGEEFVILLPNTTATAALEIAERCRNIVIAQQIEHAMSSVSDVVTVSVGVSTITPTTDTEQSLLFATADKMLYQAKKNGRNCIEYC